MDVDEFMAFQWTRSKGEHWDLIEGVAVMTSPASMLHKRVSSNLRDLLNRVFRADDLDWDLYAFGKAAERIPGLRNFPAGAGGGGHVRPG
jgi:hypothetical protein